MANLKSSKKDVRRINTRTLRNNSTESKVATFYKKAKDALLTASDMSSCLAAIVEFESAGASAARKNILSKKTISRRVSTLVLAAKKKFA